MITSGSGARARASAFSVIIENSTAERPAPRMPANASIVRKAPNACLVTTLRSMPSIRMVLADGAKRRIVRKCARADITTAILLTGVSFLVYLILAWYTPKTYSNTLNATLDEQTKIFISEISQMPMEETGGILITFLIIRM